MATRREDNMGHHDGNDALESDRDSASESDEEEEGLQDADGGSHVKDENDSTHNSDEDQPPSKHKPFDKRLVAVNNALDNVEPPGAYLTEGLLVVFPQPAITLDGLGVVPLPVVGDAAKALIAKCHLAPYGHGERTIVNTGVRNTWELSANQFRLDNSTWNTFIQEQVVPACRVPLGIHESVTFEAKLYKLLMYEAGGKFKKHKDSEKEDGMFGTLVVVLPGVFGGGELVVHDPSFAFGDDDSKAVQSHVWNSAAMDPHAIKYAAFYGDCPHEVKPVTAGYRVCLTYNLVVVKAIESAPRFGVNHPKYAALKSALCEFFCDKTLDKAKRQRLDLAGAKRSTGFEISNPETHRFTKLVYVLNHKYTKAGLSFQYLKNKDALVAASLAQFCEDSQGALSLHLCKVKYDFAWEGRQDTWYDSDGSGSEADACKCLHLKSPWVEYAGFVGKGLAVGTERTVKVPDGRNDKVWGDLDNEVAPVGLFDDPNFEFDGKNEQEHTGNEGAVLEKWYTSAALVLVTVKERAKLSFVDGTKQALQEWVATVETDQSRASAMAAGFSTVPRNWSLVSANNLPFVEAVVEMKSLSVLRDIVLSCEHVEFQPKLRQLTRTFCYEAVASMITELGNAWARRFAGTQSNGNWSARNSVNIVASVLMGEEMSETDATAVKTVLRSIKLQPFKAQSRSFNDVVYNAVDTSPKEYARVLKHASAVSAEEVKLLLPETDVRTLVLIDVPAVLHFLMVLKESSSTALKPEQIREIVRSVADRVQAKLPSLRNWPYQEFCFNTRSYYCKEHKTCQCDALINFLDSEDESIELETAGVDSHLWPLIKRKNLHEKLSAIVSEKNEGKTVVTKTFENNLFLKAERDLLALLAEQ